MGGSSSKSSTKSETTEYNVSQADYSTGDGSRTDTTVAGTGNTVSVTATDFGAIEKGAEIAKDSIAGMQATVGQAFNFGGQALQFADQASARATAAVTSLAAQQERSNKDTVAQVLSIAETIKTGGESQTKKLALYGAGLLTVAVLAVAFIFKGKRA